MNTSEINEELLRKSNKMLFDYFYKHNKEHLDGEWKLPPNPEKVPRKLIQKTRATPCNFALSRQIFASQNSPSLFG